MIIIGLVTGLASAAVGLPGAVAFGFLAGLLDIILTVGPTIAMIIAGLVAYFAGSTFLPLSNTWFMILVAALFLAIKLFEDVWLRPRIMGHTLKMHPASCFYCYYGGVGTGWDFGRFDYYSSCCFSGDYWPLSLLPHSGNRTLARRCRHRIRTRLKKPCHRLMKSAWKLANR